jgi:hypothetical protein
MSISPQRQALEQKIGGMLFGLSIALCGLEMVPGWGILRLGWPPTVFIGVMAACGAVSGWLLATDHRLPGLFGGLAAGPGALLAVAFVLAWMTWTHTVILLLAGAVGALPGFAVYGILAALENALMRTRDARAARTDADFRREFGGPPS